MNKNIGSIDRVIRFVGGVILLYLGYAVISNGVLQFVFSALGVIAVLESFTGYCGLYKMLGINTNRQMK